MRGGQFLSILMGMKFVSGVFGVFRQRGVKYQHRGPETQSAPLNGYILGLIVLLAVGVFAAAYAQTGTNSSGNLVHDYSGIPPMNPGANPTPDANRFMEDAMKAQNSRKQLEELNTLRHKEMTVDTNQLVVLAIQLKAETDATIREKLSMVDLRKIERIEKLAKGVKDKMRGTAGEAEPPIPDLRQRY